MLASSPVFSAPTPNIDSPLPEAPAAAPDIAPVLRERLWHEVFLIITPTMCVLQLALFAWLQQIIAKPTEPLGLTLMAVLIGGYSAYRLVPVWKRLHRAKTGHPPGWLIDEALAAAKDQGAVTFQDLPGQDERHIDHVIIAPTGIFVVSIRPPMRGQNGSRRVQIIRERDEHRIMVGGLPMLDDPGFQLTEAASGLSMVLRARCGEKHEVRPVVVFPGADVSPTPPAVPYLAMSDEDFHRELCLAPDIISAASIGKIAKELAKAHGGRR